MNKNQGIDVVFCDDTQIANIPEETPEQAEIWAKEKKKLVEKYSLLL